MTNRACAYDDCEQSKNGPVHLSTSPEYHPFMDSTKGGLQPISAPRRAYLESGEHKAVYAEASADEFCVGHAAGAPGRCMGPLTPHHTAPRGRFGGQRAAEETAAVVMVCVALNDDIENDAETAEWARTHFFMRQGKPHPFLLSVKERA